MDCSQINELLMDYLYQELDPSSAERFEAHLHSCPGCTELISGFEATRSAFRELPEEDPPAAVSAFLLREAAAAVAPEQEGFWERLRQGLRAMVMHPAMSIATTLVLVLGVSFYVYRQGPATGEREMIDVPLVEEEHSIAADRTAAIGMPDTEQARDEAPAKGAPAPVVPVAQPAGTATAPVQVALDESKEEEGDVDPRQLRAQAPAPKEAGYKELAGLNRKKGGSQGNEGWGKGDNASPATTISGTRARRAASTRDTLARKVASAPPAAEPAPAPPPEPRPSSTRPQLLKRSEKASLSMADLEAATGKDVGEANVVGGAGRAASGAVAVASPRAKPKKPAPARRPARSADKNKDSLDTSNYWQRGGGRKMAQVATPAEELKPRAGEDDQVQGESTTEQETVTGKTGKRMAKPRPTVAAKSPAPETQQRAGPSPAQSQLQQGHALADKGSCLEAYSYYDRAIALQPSLRSDSSLTARIGRCATNLTRGGDELPLVMASKKYPHLASLLNPQIKRVRSKRIASNEAAEQKKAAKKAKKSGKKVRTKDKAATSY